MYAYIYDRVDTYATRVNGIAETWYLMQCRRPKRARAYLFFLTGVGGWVGDWAGGRT